MTDTAEIQEHPATGFDVEAWLQDAKMPEESTDVYQRADVIGELSALRRQIELQHEAAAGAERSAGDTDELATLVKRYDELVRTFAGSQLTIFTRALGPDERKAAREVNEKRNEGKAPDEVNRDFGYVLLSMSIIAVKPFEGERTPVSWSPELVRKMENTIGGTQMSAVLDAHRLAQNKLPEVDADFLHRLSGEDAGQG